MWRRWAIRASSAASRAGYRVPGCRRIRSTPADRWHQLSANQKAVEVSHANVRAAADQAMATLKAWRLLRKLRCSPSRITELVRAVLALQLNVLWIPRLRAMPARERPFEERTGSTASP
ncbi:hypothetical protein GCM10010381_27310 [Streptomyces xantholiticus]|nr:hypothetical protein GCM10010381_27310 [Streptomyces xantholiticus]